MYTKWSWKFLTCGNDPQSWRLGNPENTKRGSFWGGVNFLMMFCSFMKLIKNVEYVLTPWHACSNHHSEHYSKAAPGGTKYIGLNKEPVKQMANIFPHYVPAADAPAALSPPVLPTGNYSRIWALKWQYWLQNNWPAHFIVRVCWKDSILSLMNGCLQDGSRCPGIRHCEARGPHHRSPQAPSAEAPWEACGADELWPEADILSVQDAAGTHPASHQLRIQ